ncbi:hypothetical protein ColTof4_10741 [Colletotrichum tofieldiae]|nr:hypothetical protein ColTof3_06859 [Colletotrichum tofieldiae]GKT78318.1 hypothetical protein ColTof4_10741 [Colletotrichum tofieldiae]
MALAAMKPSAATGRAHEATSLAALLAGSIELTSTPSQRGRGYDPGWGQVDILLVDFDLTLGSNRTVRDGARGGDGGSGDGGNKGAVVDIWLI